MTVMVFTTLSTYSEMIEENRKEWANALPELSSASEAINQCFQTLIIQNCHLPLDKLYGYAQAMLSFGSYSSWIDAHLQATSGQLPSSWSDIRRAIEFAFSSAKIGQSDKRARYWQDGVNLASNE